jgi:hypothetical protein
MQRLSTLVIGMLLASPALASQPGAPATQPAAVTPAAASPPSPAADKVYPPLPSLAMLPPGSDDDDEPAPKASSKKRKWHSQEPRMTTPMARLVVSDESRAYLKGIEQKLDLALAK